MDVFFSKKAQCISDKALNKKYLKKVYMSVQRIKTEQNPQIKDIHILKKSVDILNSSRQNSLDILNFSKELKEVQNLKKLNLNKINRERGFNQITRQINKKYQAQHNSQKLESEVTQILNTIEDINGKIRDIKVLKQSDDISERLKVLLSRKIMP